MGREGIINRGRSFVFLQHDRPHRYLLFLEQGILGMRKWHMVWIILMYEYMRGKFNISDAI